MATEPTDFDSPDDPGRKDTHMSTNTTYTLKLNPAKYSNMHQCDQKYWPFTCDFSVPQDGKSVEQAMKYTVDLLTDIVKANAFKAENVAAAQELLDFMLKQNAIHFPKGKVVEASLATFIAYQYQRWAFRIWYRDTKAAREATRPTPAKQEKPKAEPKAKKAPAKQEKAPAKKAPAKQDIAKANEQLAMSKLTKAQKKELLLALMTELLK